MTASLAGRSWNVLSVAAARSTDVAVSTLSLGPVTGVYTADCSSVRFVGYTSPCSAALAQPEPE